MTMWGRPRIVGGIPPRRPAGREPENSYGPTDYHELGSGGGQSAHFNAVILLAWALRY